MVQLGANRYGKAEVRVVHVGRGAGHRTAATWSATGTCRPACPATSPPPT